MRRSWDYWGRRSCIFITPTTSSYWWLAGRINKRDLHAIQSEPDDKVQTQGPSDLLSFRLLAARKQPIATRCGTKTRATLRSPGASIRQNNETILRAITPTLPEHLSRRNILKSETLYPWRRIPVWENRWVKGWGGGWRFREDRGGGVYLWGGRRRDGARRQGPLQENRRTDSEHYIQNIFS